MDRILSSLRSHIAVLQKQPLSASTINDNVIRKVGLMYGITLVGIVFLILLGTLAFIQGNFLLATFDFLTASVLFVILFFLSSKGYLNACIRTGITTMFCLYLYLFISGGVAGTAFLWSYTFPLFVFFLLGSRKGLLVSSLYFLSCLAVLITDLNSSMLNLYDKDLALRFIPSFLVVILFSAIYEKFREITHQALVESGDNLEKEVEERTRELVQEVQIRKEKAAELRVSESRYRALYDNSGDGISIISLDGQYRSANQHFCERLGYSEEELKAIGPKDIYQLGSDFSIDGILDEVLSTGSTQFEAEQVSKSNGHFPVEVRAKRIEFDQEGAILCSCRDISERKKIEEKSKTLQERLFRAEKMEAIGMMAGGVAHDLNNILAGIIGYPDLLLMQLPESSNLRKPVQAIQESGKRAATVVADLLTVARGAASVREAHDINRLIDGYLNSPDYKKLISFHPGIVCTTQFNAEKPIISCSPVHIKNSLMNLITNAAEAMHRRGNILVTTYNELIEKPKDSEHELDQGDYVVLTVQDSGPGIAGEDMAHIFEPFYTKKVMGRSGTGLGLAIVWNTVHDHNGKIFVESSKKGTTFRLYFPLSQERQVVETGSDKLENIKGNGEHVLVVDDEFQLRDVAKKMLEILGYTVDSVNSGEEAIEFIKTTQVDLLVIDMLMEPGMNGRQTYAELIKLNPDQKAIITSGFSETAEVKKALSLGAGIFIKKPYSINQLGNAVKQGLKDFQAVGQRNDRQ